VQERAGHPDRGPGETQTSITVAEYGDLSELAALTGGLDTLRLADLSIEPA
jgi:hypothetical protein